MQSKNLIKCAAAGSGKTWSICYDALKIVNSAADKKVLITTYTNKGVEAIEKALKKQNCGVLNSRIVICSWYQFLLYDLLRPYQAFIAGINEINSFDFSNMYGVCNYHKAGSKARYMNQNGDVRANCASEMVIMLNSLSKGRVLHRLETIYSNVFIDEIQDMAGYDLAIINMILCSSITTVCTGDNKQATYRTHNTQKGKKQTGANIWEFFKEIKDRGLSEIEDNLCSRRFNEQICQFANNIFPNENNITTCMNEETEHDGVFLIHTQDVPAYYKYCRPTVLKYDKNTCTSGYPSLNFGQCKGMTFERVLIYPNGPLIKFLRGESIKSPSKYYVAVTRPKYSLAFVVDDITAYDLFQETVITLGNVSISAAIYKG